MADVRNVGYMPQMPQTNAGYDAVNSFMQGMMDVAKLALQFQRQNAADARQAQQDREQGLFRNFQMDRWKAEDARLAAADARQTEARSALTKGMGLFQAQPEMATDVPFWQRYSGQGGSFNPAEPTPTAQSIPTGNMVGGGYTPENVQKFITQMMPYLDDSAVINAVSMAQNYANRAEDSTYRREQDEIKQNQWNQTFNHQVKQDQIANNQRQQQINAQNQKSTDFRTRPVHIGSGMWQDYDTSGRAVGQPYSKGNNTQGQVTEKDIVRQMENNRAAYRNIRLKQASDPYGNPQAYDEQLKSLQGANLELAQMLKSMFPNSPFLKQGGGQTQPQAQTGNRPPLTSFYK